MSEITSSQNKTLQASLMLKDIIALKENFSNRTEQTEHLRKVPQQSIDELQEAGFFLALQPKRYGGYELDPQDFFRMQIEIAESCMSTAWASGIIAVHALQVALMDERAQQAVWGDSIHTRISSAYAPLGKVEVAEGGFMFSGRWGWSSGSDHCTWALLGAIVPGEGYRTFLIPRTAYRVEDTWHSMGLQGTGSNDIVVDPVFVADYMTHKQSDGFECKNPGQLINDAPLYSLPWAQLFIRVVSSPAIGACKAALQLYKQGALNKASSDITKLSGDPQVVENLASAAHKIDEMECVLFRNFDQMMAKANAGEVIEVSDRLKYRYQASLVIEKSMQVVDALFSSAGGASVFTGSEIQQRFLDIHTARAHVANNPTGFARNFGGDILGLENKDFFV